jgi:glycerate kinase
LFALCGNVSIERTQLRDLGIEKVYAILNDSISLDDAMKDTEVLLNHLSFRVGTGLLESSSL